MMTESSILSLMNAVHVVTTCLLKIHVNVIHCMPVLTEAFTYCACTCEIPVVCCLSHPSNSLWYTQSDDMRLRAKMMQLLFMHYFQVSVTSCMQGSNILPSTWFTNTLKRCYILVHTYRTSGKIVALCISVFSFLCRKLRRFQCCHESIRGIGVRASTHSESWCWMEVRDNVYALSAVAYEETVPFFSLGKNVWVSPPFYGTELQAYTLLIELSRVLLSAISFTRRTVLPSEVSEESQGSQDVWLMPRQHVYLAFFSCQIKEVSLLLHLHLLTSCTCVLTTCCMNVLFMCHSVFISKWCLAVDTVWQLAGGCPLTCLLWQSRACVLQLLNLKLWLYICL